MADTIQLLEAQYFQLVDPPFLAIPPGNVLVRPDIQITLYERMFDEALTTLPPVTYRTRVLKLIIARIEESISDPEEDVCQPNLSSYSAMYILNEHHFDCTKAYPLSRMFALTHVALTHIGNSGLAHGLLG